jgi:hypothetical protein
MHKTSQQIPNNLGIPTTAHEVVNAFAVNPDVSNNATIRPANRLVCNSFPFNKVRQSVGSLLPAIFPKFRAVNTCKSYPLTATSDKRITIIDFGTFCMICHYISPFIIFNMSIICVLCYNAFVTYKRPPWGWGGSDSHEHRGSLCPKHSLSTILQHSPILIYLLKDNNTRKFLACQPFHTRISTFAFNFFKMYATIPKGGYNAYMS